MKIVTHSGHFHADELLAVAMLLRKFPDAEVIRSREQAVIDSGDYVVDVGLVYDPDKNRFDHHQTEGAGKRPNGIPYAPTGLVWKKFGVELAGGEEEAQLIDEKLLMSVDSLDNGVDVYKRILDGVDPYTIGDFFESFGKVTNTEEEMEQAFFEALRVAQALVEREIISAKKSVAEWREVRKIYDESVDKRIILLPVHMHWKRTLIPTEAVFVVYPADNKWRVQSVPSRRGLFDKKVTMPSSWRGLSGEGVAKASGVPDAYFCHRDGHLAGAQSKEGAIRLAEIALEA